MGIIMSTDVKRINWKKVAFMLVLGVFAAILFVVFGSTKAEAKTFTIRTPDQLKNINWKNAGYGPGHTYKIGNDMTLGDSDDATCLLTKGKFTIDFNGHTVQNANHALTVFKVAGADVTMKDSKVKSDKPSVRSYGAGAVQIVGGKLTINSGNYLGASDGTNNPCGLHVGGGSCVINGGAFLGDYCGADLGGGSLRINNGYFQAGYSFAFMTFGGRDVSIMRGTFVSGKTTYGYQFALGAYGETDGTFSFNNWLASGSSFDTDFQMGYWNMQSSVTAYPTIANYWAVAYNTPTLRVTSSIKAPKATSIKSLKASSRSINVKWKKVTANNSGYIVQYSTSSKFKGGKTVTVKGSSKTSRKLTGLKSGKKYYVRVRTYRNVSGYKLTSKWSKAKSKTAG